MEKHRDEAGNFKHTAPAVILIINHCWPVKREGESLEANNNARLQAAKDVFDLNGKIEFRQIFSGNAPGVIYDTECCKHDGSRQFLQKADVFWK